MAIVFGKMAISLVFSSCMGVKRDYLCIEY